MAEPEEPAPEDGLWPGGRGPAGSESGRPRQYALPVGAAYQSLQRFWLYQTAARFYLVGADRRRQRYGPATLGVLCSTCCRHPPSFHVETPAHVEVGGVQGGAGGG